MFLLITIYTGGIVGRYMFQNLNSTKYTVRYSTVSPHFKIYNTHTIYLNTSGFFNQLICIIIP